MRWLRRAALVLAAVLPIVLWFAMTPVRGAPPALRSSPAGSFDEALRRVRAIQAADGPEVHPLCRTRLLDHGRRVERVVVLLHGFTNCPRQFERLGRMLHELGYNVYIPRLPRHGLRDRMTTELARLTAGDFVESGNRAVDVARGLGDRVSVVGLSSSAVLAAWLAQRRGDVDQAMLLAPSFGPKDLPAPAARGLTNLLLKIPNVFLWWDLRRRERTAGPPNTYPRFPTRALAEVYRLGFFTIDEAGRAPPGARSVFIVTTAFDKGVNNDVTGDLAALWRSRGARVAEHEFPDSLEVHHDMIDPLQPYQRVAITYRLIVELLTTGSQAARSDARAASAARGYPG